MNEIDDSSEQEKSDEIAVLLVDDESNILSSLKRILRPMGFKILTAGNGVEGLAVLEQEAVDLIISDMRMPEMDGAEFLASAAQKWPDTLRILLTGYADITSAVKAINEGKIYKYINKPWDDNDLKINIMKALELKHLEKEKARLEALTARQNEELKHLNASLEDKVKERTRELEQTMGRLDESNKSLKKSYSSSIKAFASLIEMREGTMAGHSRRVADIARKLAQAMNLSSSEIQDVVFAGLLHDIGKIGLPDKLLSTPYNSLSSVEKNKVNKHPVLGQAALIALDPLQNAAEIIRSHHERYDGTGYPDGLHGNQIPIGSQILAVVNDYDAAQCGTLWSQRLTSEEAMEYINRKSGKHYSQRVVEQFTAILGDVKESNYEAVIQLNTGDLEAGMVVAKDITADGGILLLSEGHILDEHLIRRIKKFEDSIDSPLSVHIYINKKVPA